MRWTLAWLVMIISAGAGELRLSRPFSSHMVLPMDQEVTLQGMCDPGKAVSVHFMGRDFNTVADRQGAWQLSLPATPASFKPLTLEVDSEGTRVLLEDILIGEVWLCSGQSNMDFPLSRSTGGAEEVAKAELPQLRLLNLTSAPVDARAYDAATLARLNVNDHFQGSWSPCTPAAVGGLSAVAYHTGRLIQAARKVPVGLVENAVGGSGAEAWMPVEILKSRPEYAPLLGAHWMDSDKIGNWAKGRAKQNLDDHLEANHPFKPGFLFESGLRPWAGFPFTGVMWYQGETNAEVPDDAWNERLIRDLVTGWRSALRQPNLRFFMVQLPRIGGNDPARQYWPAFREVQARAVKALPNTHLIVTMDLGWESPDVHPPDKLPVARRLAESILSLDKPVP